MNDNGCISAHAGACSPTKATSSSVMARVRGMTLLEIMVTMSAVAVIATAGATSLVEQVKRVRATDAANAALYPHTVARDRAVARRSCTETVLVPALPDAFITDIAAFPAGAQRSVPRIAVLEWDGCDETANLVNVKFFDLDGDITLQPYSSDDGRAVFGIRGGLTAERPGATSGFIDPDGKDIPQCSAGGSKPSGGGISEGEGEGEGPPPACAPPGPLSETPVDITFAATTYFGANVPYTIFARAGATEAN